jgi:hypothetical protein
VSDFPFTQPEGSDVNMFIQWKGTDVCLDFQCPCGTSGHLDADFAYYIHCPGCDAVYRMGTQVIAKRVPDLADDVGAKTLEVD